MSIKIKSEVTKIKYDPDDILFFTCMPQIALYYENGAQIVDINVDRGRMAVAFWKKDHMRLRDLWNHHKL